MSESQKKQQEKEHKKDNKKVDEKKSTYDLSIEDSKKKLYEVINGKFGENSKIIFETLISNGIYYNEFWKLEESHLKELEFSMGTRINLLAFINNSKKNKNKV